jgi:cation transport ATPase
MSQSDTAHGTAAVDDDDRFVAEPKVSNGQYEIDPAEDQVVAESTPINEKETKELRIDTEVDVCKRYKGLLRTVSVGLIVLSPLIFGLSVFYDCTVLGIVNHATDFVLGWAIAAFGWSLSTTHHWNVYAFLVFLAQISAIVRAWLTFASGRAVFYLWMVVLLLIFVGGYVSEKLYGALGLESQRAKFERQFSRSPPVSPKSQLRLEHSPARSPSSVKASNPKKEVYAAVGVVAESAGEP